MLTARSYATVLGSVRKSYAWTDWLAHAGLLTDGVRTGRGVAVTAKDGHLCRSLLERQIDDFFHDNGIVHEPEPPYPFDAELNLNGYRADWKLFRRDVRRGFGLPERSGLHGESSPQDETRCAPRDSYADCHSLRYPGSGIDLQQVAAQGAPLIGVKRAEVQDCR